MKIETNLRIDSASRAVVEAAEAIWQAESLRADGRPRRITFNEESGDTRQKYMFLAGHAVMAVIKVLVR